MFPAKPRVLGASLLLAMLLTTACGTQRHAVHPSRDIPYCTPTTNYPEEQRAYWAEPQTVPLAAHGLDRHSERMCQILGITAAVDRLQRMGPDSVGSLEHLVLEMRIRDRISLARTQILAVAAEIACEAARAESLADELDVKNDRRNTRLTVASVVVGAAATIATVAINDGPTETAAGVGGGLLSIGLGALTISPKGRVHHFTHERNLLRAIWYNDLTIPGYPYVVEQLLNDPLLSNSGTVPLAGSLRERWAASIFLGSDSELEALLFGSGGGYHADELHTRAELLEQLAATVNGLHQDLASLMGAIMRKQ